MQPSQIEITFRDINYTAFIEKDTDGYFVAEVPTLKSCYTQARTLEELFPRIREVIEFVWKKNIQHK